jgi:hypothetical protein
VVLRLAPGRTGRAVGVAWPPAGGAGGLQGARSRGAHEYRKCKRPFPLPLPLRSPQCCRGSPRHRERPPQRARALRGDLAGAASGTDRFLYGFSALNLTCPLADVPLTSLYRRGRPRGMDFMRRGEDARLHGRFLSLRCATKLCRGDALCESYTDTVAFPRITCSTSCRFGSLAAQPFSSPRKCVILGEVREEIPAERRVYHDLR